MAVMIDPPSSRLGDRPREMKVKSDSTYAGAAGRDGACAACTYPVVEYSPGPLMFQALYFS